MAKLGLELMYESDSGRVYWDTDLQCVYIDGKQYTGSAAFRAVLERSLQLLNERRCHKFLADISMMGVAISAEDMVWTEADWFPRCLKAGLKYFALVMPKALGTHLSVDKLTQKFDPGTGRYFRAVFTDLAAAKEWLRKS
jgi:hypothetical protein